MGGFLVVTNEISSGVKVREGRAPVTSAADSGELADKFSDLLRQLVGETDLKAGFDSAANLGFIQVNVAVAPPKEVIEAPKEEEAPVKEAAVETEDEVQVATEEDDGEDKEAVVAQEEVDQAAVPVQTAQPVVTEAPEVAKEELPVEVVTPQVIVQGTEEQTKTEQEVPGFVLNKAAPEQAAVAQTAKTEQVESPQAIQQPQEAFQDVQAAAAVPVQKNGSAKPAGRNPQEDYARLQRILESAADSEAQDAPEPAAPAAPVDAKPALALEKEALRQEVAAAQQGLARAGAESEQSDGRTLSGKGSGAQGLDGVGFGNQNAAIDKAAAGKGKTQGTQLLAKDVQKVVDQVKELLQKAIQNRDGNTISVRLNPPELGQMTVKVTQRDSQVYARIIPESPEVEAALRTRAAEVTQVLVAAGLKADQVLVSIGRERTDGETLQFQQFMGQSNSGEFAEHRERSSGEGRESSSFFGSAGYAAEDSVADSGWIA